MRTIDSNSIAVPGTQRQGIALDYQLMQPLFSEYSKSLARNIENFGRYYHGDGFSIWYYNYDLKFNNIMERYHRLYLKVFVRYKPKGRSLRLKDILLPVRFAFYYNNVCEHLMETKEKDEHVLLLSFDRGYLLSLWADFDGLKNVIENKKYVGKTIPCSRIMSVLIKEFILFAVAGETQNLRIRHWLLELLSESVSLVPGKHFIRNTWLNFQDIEALLAAKKLVSCEKEERPTLENLGKKVGLNQRKLKEGFKFLFGKSIYDYHLSFHLENARYFLKYTDKSIQDIAYTIGYNQPSGFAQGFKRMYGCSPTEYRKQKIKN